jgi:hypothetical protein
MLMKVCILAVLMTTALPIWPQVEGAAKEEPVTDNTVDTDSRMFTPPPVSGEAYPSEGVGETRSNYISAGVSFNSAYTDNAFVDSGGHQTGDLSYSIWPTITLDKTSTRLHSSFTYSPGFTFFERQSSSNQANHNTAVAVQYRLSPHVTLSVQDSFQKTSNIFNQPDSTLATPVFGSGEPPAVAVIVPVGDQLFNRANVGISYQYGPNGMVGATGTFTNLHYPNPAQVPGLFDSNSKGGSAFYTHRFSRKHYVGVSYDYNKYLSDSAGAPTNIQAHTMFAFYTICLSHNLSVSLSGGPQLSDVTQFGLPASQTWSPYVSTSVGWQGHRTSLAASYSRIVTSGNGLSGAFHSNTANAAASWQLARTWHMTISGNYSNYKNLEPLLSLSSPGGHSLAGTASIAHDLGRYLNLAAGYTRWHQSYSTVPVATMAPDSNREFLSVSYRFSRAIGR